jgi:hypothetical protein
MNSTLNQYIHYHNVTSQDMPPSIITFLLHYYLANLIKPSRTNPVSAAWPWSSLLRASPPRWPHPESTHSLGISYSSLGSRESVWLEYLDVNLVSNFNLKYGVLRTRWYVWWRAKSRRRSGCRSAQYPGRPGPWGLLALY